MKQSEHRRAEREARADVAAHGTSSTRREGGLARYLAAIGYDDAKRSGDQQPEEPGSDDDPSLVTS